MASASGVVARRESYGVDVVVGVLVGQKMKKKREGEKRKEREEVEVEFTEVKNIK